MLTAVHPTLPMRNKAVTQQFYVAVLGFTELGAGNGYDEYLMVRKDGVELHFFLSPGLNPADNDGMAYIRCTNVDAWYQLALHRQLDMPECGHIRNQPWMQRECAFRDPDGNLLTFGQDIS